MTSTMKYALLSGFLLSTGEDTEAANVPGREPQRHPGLVDGDPPEPEPSADGSLIGTVAAGKPPADLELRYEPDGRAYTGFALTQGRKRLQVVAVSPLADVLQPFLAGIVGQRVSCWGTVEMVPWRKGDRDMPPYQRLQLERIKTPDGTLPSIDAMVERDVAEVAEGSPTETHHEPFDFKDMLDDTLPPTEALPAPLFPDPISDAEREAILAAERVEAGL
jgi:hypothetical protein